MRPPPDASSAIDGPLEEVQARARGLFNPETPYLKQRFGTLDASTDARLHETLRRIRGSAAEQQIDAFVLSHLGRMPGLLADPGKRDVCIDALVTAGIRNARDPGTVRVLNRLLLPHITQIAASRAHAPYLGCLLMGDAAARNAACAQLAPFLKLRIDPRKIFACWQKPSEAVANISQMRKLQEARPGKDIVETLYEEFGIAHFRRYSVQLLARQYDTRGDHHPYGLSISGYKDHNGALSQDVRMLETAMPDSESRGVRLRVAEFGSPRDLARVLLGLRRKHEKRAPEGQAQKIRYAIVNDHGETHSTESGIRVDTEDGVESDMAKALAAGMEKGAWVLLASCSTGKEDDGLAARFSELGLRVAAPPADAEMRQLCFLDDPLTGVRPVAAFLDANTGTPLPTQIFIDGRRQTRS